MIRVGLVTNPLDPADWREHEVEDVCAFLAEQFASWPESARIYDLEGFGDWTRAAALTDPSVLSRRDITPRDEAGIERLARAPGPLLVTVPPADPLTLLIAVVAVAAGVAAAFLFLPSPNLDAQRPQSPNNALAGRTNKPRPNGRIADIYGTVEAVPDLLAHPLAIFSGGIEVEVSYLIIGRGSYSVSRVRDGDTAVASIAGSSVAVYGPDTSPNTGDPPELQIGDPIAELVRTVRRLNEVNGQVLKATNLNAIQGENDIRFVHPDSIEAIGDIDFTELFADGDALTILQADISGASGVLTTEATVRFTSAGEVEFDTDDPSATFSAGDNLTISGGAYAGETDLGGVLYVDLSGTYLIDSVTSTKIVLDDPGVSNPDWTNLDEYPGDHTEYRLVTLSIPTATSGVNLNGNYVASSVAAGLITLDNPELVNAAWDNVADLPGGATEYVSPHISRSTESWVGPLIVDLDDASEVSINVVAMAGLYTLSKEKGRQRAITVGFTLEITPIDSNNSPIGPAEEFPGTITGSATERTTIGTTLTATPSFVGRSSIRLRRTTASPAEDDFSAIVDEIKWRDAYGLAPIGAIAFGDVTTVMSRTIATPGALSLKERRLNMRVTRKLPERTGTSTFGARVATDSAADIIAALSLDPYIGRREASEVDFDSIYDTIEEVEDHFGSPLAARFGYTFDDVQLSFEETAQIVAQSCFCKAYRQGRVIRLSFERATTDSSLLFNARNILPGSQRRSVRFGPLDDHDGIELDYTAPEDGAAQTLVVPLAGDPTKPRRVDLPGARSYELAFWHAWRAWNKVLHQHITAELEATQEAALTIPNDRVLIADLTRPDVLQGECVSIDGTLLELSDLAPLDPLMGWTIFLQHIDGTIEPLGVEQADPLDIPEGANVAYWVELSAEPRMELSLEFDSVRRALYMIVPDDDAQARAFLISEREPQANFTEHLSAVNYSFLYYQHDQLRLWVPIMGGVLADESAFRLGIVAAGGGALAADLDRDKSVYDGAGGASQITISGLSGPGSYTKAAWVKGGTAGNLLGNANEAFRLSGGSIELAHGATAIGEAVPDAAWHFWAASFDDDSGLGALYLDGQLVAEGALPDRASIALQGMIGFDGLADELRLYPRALDASEIRSIYLATRIG